MALGWSYDIDGVEMMVSGKMHKKPDDLHRENLGKRSRKLCTACHKVKPIDDFSVDKRMKLRRHSHCKECRAAYQKSHFRVSI